MKSVSEVQIAIVRLAGYSCVSWQKFEIDYNSPKHGRDQEKSPSVTERKRTAYCPVRSVHRGATRLDGSPPRVLPKRRQPRPPLLNPVHPTWNSVSREDESGQLETTPAKEPRNWQHSPNGVNDHQLQSMDEGTNSPS
jgi:hypothetical protein